MATRTWIGGATAVAKSGTIQITAYDAATTYTLTFTGENGATTAISTSGGGTVGAVASALNSAVNASLHPFVEFVSSSVNSDTITLTSGTAGRPFYVTPSVAGGTGTIGSYTAVTTTSGPNDYNCITNWVEGAVPVANDTVYITGSNAISYGLDQSSVEVDGFYVNPGYSGAIGSASLPLKIDVDNTTAFEFSGTGTSYIEVGNFTGTCRVRKTRAASGGSVGLQLYGSGIGTVIVEAGVVRLLGATVTTLLVGSESGTTVYVPSGNTLTTLHNQGGTVVLGSAVTTANNQSGTLTTEGSGAITTLNVDAGTVYSESSGTITTLNADGGTVDFTGSRVARTVTTTNLRGSILLADLNVVTFTTLNYNYPVKITAA